MKEKNFQTQKLVTSALLLAVGLILPFFTAQVPAIGNMLLPMHIPVLLCGFLCGAPYGAVVGFILPLLRSALFGMPPMVPVAAAMSLELAAYGFLTGFCYQRSAKNWGAVYGSLILSMIGGRVVWGLASFALYRALGMAFTWKLFAMNAFLNAIPGILIQLVLIPALVQKLTIPWMERYAYES